MLIMFQSTPLQRGDLSKRDIMATLHVSIHAPAKGRLSAIIRYIGQLSFNPRPCKGATEIKLGKAGMSVSFNPRPCKGATGF